MRSSGGFLLICGAAFMLFLYFGINTMSLSGATCHFVGQPGFDVACISESAIEMAWIFSAGAAATGLLLAVFGTSGRRNRAPR